MWVYGLHAAFVAGRFTDCQRTSTIEFESDGKGSITAGTTSEHQAGAPFGLKKTSELRSASEESSTRNFVF
jgi:hypothetical protein